MSTTFLESLELTVAVTALEVSDCAGACAACPAVGSCAERLVCRCLKVTEETIIGAIRTYSLATVSQLKTATGAGDGCMCCHKELKAYLAVYSPASSSSPSMCSVK